MMKLTLNSLFDYTNNDGIFTYLASQNVPWKEDIDADLLDLDYHSKHGTKVVSKTVTSLLTQDGLSAANKTKLAKLLYTKNKPRWDELYESMALYDDINPLDNTNWTESRTLSHSGTDTKSQTLGSKETTFQEGAQTDTYNKGSQSNSNTIGQQTFTEGQQIDNLGSQTVTEGEQTNTVGGTLNTREHTRSAFNSGNSYEPDNKDTENNGARNDIIGAKTTTNGARDMTKGSREDTTSSRSDSSTEGAREDSSTKGQRTDTTTEGAQTNSESGTNAFSDTETITKHGNIGVTTNEQLVNGWRRIVNWQFFEIIYKDIDSILCLEVFGCDDDDFSDYKIVTPYTLPIASASKLGGIKVGQNLSIASDGTLNAQAGGGAVESVNGKTGAVVLNASDVGAASSSDVVNIRLDISQLQGSVLDLTNKTNTNTNDIVNIKLDINQLQGSVLGLHNDLVAVRQVPTGGTEGQVLTKGASGYDWQTPSGGGGESSIWVPVFSNITTGQQDMPYAFNIDDDVTDIMIGDGNDNIYIQPISPSNSWENSILSKVCEGTGRLYWDGKIAALSGFNSQNANLNKYKNIYIKTKPSHVVRKTTSLPLSYKDVADATYNFQLFDSNLPIHHILVSVLQYNSVNSYPPSLYYKDAQNVEHDITNDCVLKVYGTYDRVFYLSYDCEENPFTDIKALKVIIRGYRTHGAISWY